MVKRLGQSSAETYRGPGDGAGGGSVEGRARFYLLGWTS
jgi:hypothetical protein